MADVVLASTFKSEKSFEVSSASLRNSEVSSVARLQKSSPTTTKKMTLGRILESDNTGELYRKSNLNSTAIQQREKSRIEAEQYFFAEALASALRAGKYLGAVCYWAASKAAQNAHLWLAAKVVSCTGDGGIRD
jgi:hypothetical protein